MGLHGLSVMGTHSEPTLQLNLPIRSNQLRGCFIPSISIPCLLGVCAHSGISSSHPTPGALQVLLVVGMEHPTSLCWSIPRPPGQGAMTALGGSGALLGLCPVQAGKQSRLSHRCEQCWPCAALPLTPHPAPPAPRWGTAPCPPWHLPPGQGHSWDSTGQSLGAPRVLHLLCRGWGSRAGVPVPRAGTHQARARSDKAARPRGSAGTALRKAAAREPCRLLRPARPAR